MAKRLLIEDFRVGFFVRGGVPEREVREGRRVLASAAFRRQFRGALAEIVRHHPSLRRVAFDIGW